jgi:hypothetical protein
LKSAFAVEKLKKIFLIFGQFSYFLNFRANIGEFLKADPGVKKVLEQAFEQAPVCFSTLLLLKVMDPATCCNRKILSLLPPWTEPKGS